MHIRSMLSRTCLTLCSVLLALTLSACGGGNSSSSESPSSQRLLAGATVTASAVADDYDTVVQQLYVAYYGRPADAGGLVNFKAQLLAAGAPTTVQGLDTAYSNNPQLRALIDTFGVSKESQSLYSGNDAEFVIAVYNNVLGRDPLLGGLNYWTESMKGGLQRGNVALSIMAAAMTNATAQGQLDAALIVKKINGAALFTAAVPAASYRGQGPASIVRLVLRTLTATISDADLKSAIDFAVASVNQANVATFAGVYTGTYSGADTGTFTVAIGPTGIITGDGKSTAFGYSLSILGQLTFGGSIDMKASGSAAESAFGGGVDPASGTLSGTWDAGIYGKGTFSGSKVY